MSELAKRLYHLRNPIKERERLYLIELENRANAYARKIKEVYDNLKKQRDEAIRIANIVKSYSTKEVAKRREKANIAFKKAVAKLKEREKARLYKRGGRLRELIRKAFDSNIAFEVLISKKDLDRYLNESGVETGVKGVLNYIRDVVLFSVGAKKLIKLKITYEDGFSRFVTLRASNVDKVISKLLGEGEEIYKESLINVEGLVFMVTPRELEPNNVGAAFLPLAVKQQNHEFDYKELCDKLQIMYYSDKWYIDNIPYNCLSYSLKQFDSNYYVDPNYMVESTVRRRDLSHVASDNNIYIVLHMFDKKNIMRTYRYGDKTDFRVDIGYFMKHYFKYDKIVSFPEGFGNSLRVIEYMYNKEVLEQPPYEVLYMLYRNLNKRDYSIPFYDERDLSRFCRPTKEVKQPPITDTYICYLDTETDTSGDKHQVYLASVLVTYNNVTKIYTDNNVRGVMDWLCNLPNLSKTNGKKFIVYCHNLRYDASFIVPLTGVGKWFGDLSNCKGFQAYYSHFSAGKRRTYQFQFKDSYAMLQMKLECFNDALSLGQDCNKLDFPYASYNNVQPKLNYLSRCSLESMVNNTKSKDINKLRQVIVKANALEVIDGVEVVKMLQFSKYYCELDVLILQKGIEKLRGLVLDKWSIDIHNVMTISSLSDLIQKKAGVFDDVYEIGGPILNFLQKAQHGGRCLVRGGVKQHIKGKIAYGDMTSLYPSAMVRLGGYVKGKPKPLSVPCTYKDLKRYTSYVVEINITNVRNPRMSFPIITVPQKNGDGSKIYDDSYRGKTVVSKIELECMIKYVGVEFEIIGGYYWDEGRNNKLGECVQGMFDERLKYPKTNPMNGVLKLLLNSSYGKTIQKAYSKQYESKWFQKQSDFDDYIYNNSHMIDGYIEVGTQSIVEKTVPTFNHFNRCMAGIEVLAMSKLIMYEIFDVCEKNGIEAYYTDTDSFAVEFDKWDLLSEKYLEMTGRVFEGSKLGQSHLDFETDGSGNKIKEGTIHATEAIYLDRKCYCLRVRYEDLEGKEHEYFQYRMKGVPHTSIQLKANSLCVDVMELYHRLYLSNKMEFDLLEDGNRVRFEYQKDFSVRSVREFKRSVEFTK